MSAVSTASDSAGTLPEQVYLIDASIYIFQAHFSPYVECVDTGGEDLSAVFGFAQFLLQFLGRTRATHVAVAHDESLFCGFRHQLCPNYKSNRELPDDNLAMQLRACMELCEVLGLASYASKVYEADDIIGTLSTSCRNGQVPAIEIVSRDKDLGQLLGRDGDCVWDYQHNKRRFSHDIESELGIRPGQIPDYLGLVGDAVDCITGVPGVGPVKGRELLQQFDSLEGVYEQLHKIPDLPLRGARQLASKLEEHRQLAELSKRLATIICEIPDSNETFSRVGYEDLGVTEMSEATLQSFLSEYRFDAGSGKRIRNLAARLQSA